MSQPRCPYHDQPTEAAFAITYRYKGADYADHACLYHLDMHLHSLTSATGITNVVAIDLTQTTLPDPPEQHPYETGWTPW